MKKIITFVLLSAFYSSCRIKTRQMYVFIPDKYEGHIRIFFDKSASKNHMISFGDDLYVIHLFGDVKNFKLNDLGFPSGPYEMKFFYYSTDTLYQVNNEGSNYQDKLPKYPNVSHGYSTGSKSGFYSFYVSKDENSISKYDSLQEMFKPIEHRSKEYNWSSEENL